MLHYLIGLALVDLNRPRAALETFRRRPGPDSMVRTGVAAWGFGVTATALHVLGDYEGELKEIDEAIRADPQSPTYRANRTRALIGLGRVDEVLPVTDEMSMLPGT